MTKPNIRIGYGYDVHQLAKGYDLWLGGIKVPHELGAVGHSDADVLLHVICDALLGSVALKDIGYHFPDTDPQYKGVDSKKLLSEVIALVRQHGYEIINIDSTVCLQKPKIKPYIDDMRAQISSVLAIPIQDVSVKATTTEKLGFVGTEKGISAHAVVMVYKRNPDD